MSGFTNTHAPICPATARSELLAEREVNRLTVGDVVVLGDGTTWSLASIGVVAVEVSGTDQVNDGRSWTEVLDEEFANGLEPPSKPISELADDGWIWHPSQEARKTFVTRPGGGLRKHRSGYFFAMDAISFLKDDHRTVEQLFKRFEQAGERAPVQKRQIVDRIIEELSVHTAIEEQVFYPFARATVPATEAIALESLEEHHIVKWLLSELVDMDPAHERFDAKVTVLMENVRHHVEEEERDFFPKVREHIGRNELADLGQALADAKKSAPTRPHPRMPDAGPANVVAGTLTGVIDRVGSNLSGIAQGSVTAVQDLVARVTGSDRPKVSPTGSSITRKLANEVRSATSTATDGVQETARTVKSGATSTAKAAKAGAKGTVTSAKKATSATATTAKRASTTTGRTARAAMTKTAATAKRTGSKTAAAASSSR